MNEIRRDTSNGREWRAYAFCLLAAAAIMLVCSTDSFLYPVNFWNDVDCFVTVARGMLAGKVPYRDLAEQKGPLLYALHALGLWLFPRSYHGLYLLRIPFVGTGIYWMWRAARLYRPNLSVAWMAPLLAVLCASKCYAGGDAAEEWCLPLAAGSMYAGLKALKAGEGPSLPALVGHGALAGCVLWIKFNQLGMHFAFMAVLACAVLFRDHSFKRAIAMCGAFLLGMALATVPWLIYFGIHGAVGDWLGMYLWDNVFGYTSKSTPLPVNLWLGMRRGVGLSPLLGVLLCASAVGVIRLPKAAMSRWEKALPALAAIVTALAVYGGGRKFDYYFQAFFPLCAFVALPLDALWARLKGRMKGVAKLRLNRAVACLAVLAVCVGGARLMSPNAEFIGVPYEQTVEGAIGARIREDEDRTLLNFGFLDKGFYFAADVQPVNRYFCKLNNYPMRAMADQMAVVRAAGVNFIVTNEPMEAVIQSVRGGRPELAPEGWTPDYAFVTQVEDYYLYRRVAP